MTTTHFRDARQWMKDKLAGRKKPKGLKALAAAAPVDTTYYGMHDALNGFYLVGGELNLPVPAADSTPVITTLAIPACRVVSWQGNVSVWTTGSAEALVVLSLDTGIYLPQIIKCDSAVRQGAQEPIDFTGLDWPCPAGTLTLMVAWLSDQPMNWEMQTVLKTVA